MALFVSIEHSQNFKIYIFNRQMLHTLRIQVRDCWQTFQ